MNEAVLAAGDRETGATVHLVEGEYDSGPVRFLSGADHAAYRILRLRMLREEPTAFGSNYETALDLPEAHFRECVRARMKNFIAGGFVGTDLVGSAGGYREGAVKRRHFATIWSMYVIPGERGTSLAATLLDAVLTRLKALDGLEQICLSVTAGNDAARQLY